MNTILSAVLIVGGLGLLCSLLLMIIDNLFSVDEDEKVKEIRACLPGANCGACGYSGCDQYAKALAENEAAPNLCIPGSVSVAAKLSELLSVNVCVDEPKVAFVKCNGNCKATAKKAVLDNTYTCKAAASLYGGPNTCLSGCLGCGDCAKVCPSDAICVDDGIAHINPMLCIGCGMCVKECPKNIIDLYPRDVRYAVMCSSTDKGAVARKNCTNACIGCKKCELNCPNGAIVVNNNLAEFDYDKCINCGKCREVCPVGCIQVVDFSAPISV